MATCYRCGNPIDFRVVNGQAIPFHLSGSCSSASTSWSAYRNFAAAHCITEQPIVYRVRSWSDDICYPGHCPKCGGDVFFVRHNGGSVWLDPPLGWPWPKHGCMHDDRSSADFAAIFKAAAGVVQPGRNDVGLGVIGGRIAVFSIRRFSILQIHLVNGKLRLIGVDGLHNDLVGEVVFLFLHFGRLYMVTIGGAKLFVVECPRDPF